MRTLGIDIIAQESRVNARISGQFLLIKLLNEVQRHLRRIAELAVAIHLQRGEVIERRWCLLAILFLYVSDGERLVLDEAECLFAFLFAGELTFRGSEDSIAIDRGQHPIGFGLEIVYLLLAVHNQCQRGSLYAPNAEHLSVLSIFDGIEACGIDA